MTASMDRAIRGLDKLASLLRAARDKTSRRPPALPWDSPLFKTPVTEPDRQATSREFRRILVVMLDSEEDPIGVQPALSRLRSGFPESEITLVCRSGNEFVGKAMPEVDRVLLYNFWHGSHAELCEHFRDVVGNGYHLAVDLRVEGDLRFLLTAVDGALKCGVGARWRYPFLDIALPGPEELDAQSVGRGAERLDAGAFMTRTRQQHPFIYSFDLAALDHNHLVYGPYLALPVGAYKATFWFAIEGLGDQRLRCPITFEVVADEFVQTRVRIDERERTTLGRGHVSVSFTNETFEGRYEFRINISHKPFDGTLRFFGVSLERTGYLPEAALDRSDYLLLLAELVIARLSVRPSPPTQPTVAAE
jgi:hypothetical protein